jgi:glycosyltransferase involved in cell wall biosynthesis
MQRILQVVGIMNTGGIETWLMNVLRNIDRTEIQFDFVVHTDKKGYYDDEIEKLGGKIFHVPKFNIINIYSYKKTWRILLKDSNSHIIHTHIRSTASIFLKIAKKYGFTTVAHAHSTSNGTWTHSLIRNFFQRNISKHADIRLACSKKAGNWLFKNADYRIIKNAINSSLYIFNEGIRNQYRKYFNLEYTIVIGHIGRFVFAKNHNFLIDIFANLYKQNNKFRLVLVGDGGEMKYDIKKKVQALGLENKVIFTGVRSDIPQLLQMMDLFLFPSYFEGLPISLIEAQAAGLQCFISDTISKESIITNHVYPISLNESIDIWTDMIMNNLNYKREDTSLYIRNNGYDIKTVTKELEDLYHSISKKETRASIFKYI